MFCTKCGTPIPDKANTCPGCGEAVSLPPNAQPTVPFINQTQAIERPEKKKWKLKTIYIIAACAVVVLAVLIPVLLTSAAKANQYKEAMALMDAGEPEQAKEAFVQLPGYKEADELALTCQNQIDFEAAQKLLDNGEYDAAKRAFLQLGDYGQAATMVPECEKGLKYEDAVALMNQNRNQEARDAFIELGNYKDSSDLATECKNKTDFDTAKMRMENGEYEAALATFAALGEYSNAADLAVECQNSIDYIAAEAAYQEGKFYTAYVMFSTLAGFGDSTDRAWACMQEHPDNGELYRNPDYSSKRCSLTIVTEDTGYATYMKFYTEDGTLVSTVFIASGDKYRVKLPVGTYQMKYANGADWFGPDEMFGDEGAYQILTFEDGATTASLKSSYVYTLTLGGVEDGNADSEYVDRSGF